jgi:hypothetical protein
MLLVISLLFTITKLNLTVKKNNMEEYKEELKANALVTLRPGGPVVITGEFVVVDEDGKELEKKERISICRCGLSQKMPFCDGAHKAC